MKLILFIKLFHVKQYLQVFNWSYRSRRRSVFSSRSVLREGGQNYDVMDWTQEDLIQDIIDQYERHLHFLNIVRS